jgi:DNA-directed RNA polymerase subunit RPC12/RpoP
MPNEIIVKATGLYTVVLLTLGGCRGTVDRSAHVPYEQKETRQARAATAEPDDMPRESQAASPPPRSFEISVPDKSKPDMRSDLAGREIHQAESNAALADVSNRLKKPGREGEVQPEREVTEAEPATVRPMQDIGFRTAEQSISDIAERVMPGVVRIVVYDITGAQTGQASAFFIAPGIILTNAHVIQDSYSAEVVSDTEYYDQVTVLKLDEDVDLTLLSVEDRGESILALEENENIRPGQRVIAIGNPMGLKQTVSDGLASAVRTISGEIQLIQISAPISPGSSGGPVLNEEGRVIGVASATLAEGQNLNFAIGIKTINDFLSTPDNPQPLRLARSRVLWRVVLKWTITIVLGLIAFAFGGGWWVIVVIVLVICFLGWLFKSLYRLVTAPFRKKTRDVIEDYPSDDELYSYSERSGNPPSDEAGLFQDTDNGDAHYQDIFTFHCWKCGTEINVDFADRPDSVECERCGTRLSVLEEGRS